MIENTVLKEGYIIDITVFKTKEKKEVKNTL